MQHPDPLASLHSSCLLTASPALAQFLRDPQVPIQGTSLQQLLDGLGQAIDVNTEQYFIPVFTAVFLTRPPLNLRTPARRREPGRCRSTMQSR